MNKFFGIIVFVAIANVTFANAADTEYVGDDGNICIDSSEKVVEISGWKDVVCIYPDTPKSELGPCPGTEVSGDSTEEGIRPLCDPSGKEWGYRRLTYVGSK